MDTILLSRFMVEAAQDQNQLADSFNLKVIKDNVTYRLAQNLYRYTTPLDEEGNPTGSENMARFPSFLIRLDALLSKYRDGDSKSENDDDEQEEEDSDHPSGKKKTVDNDDDDDNDSEEDDNEDSDDEDDDSDDDEDEDEDDDVDDDSDENDEDEDED